MAIEHAYVRVVRKPWGSIDLRPWSEIHHDGAAIGELWFERADASAPDPALLFKLLFTQQALSIQVHPDDAFARSLGLRNGKTEAWYILSAPPGARIAVGLKRQLVPAQLRAAIEDGSIADLVQWHSVLTDDVIFIPAGTIHAIGPGLVIAEIQQHSDATFRLFDYGRPRELHVDNAVAAATAGPAERQPMARRLSEARTLLVASPYFVLERIDLAPQSIWELNAIHETWVLVVKGRVQIGLMNAFVGEAMFLQADRTSLKAGPEGVKGLLAYLGTAPSARLLRRLGGEAIASARRHVSTPPLHRRASSGSADRAMEARQ